ncbi:hypothetical protein J4463_02465 [Candidatus Pacearchaeota archaeon]|nr:hypothetical protein [Candidatus Pacearchaeota archaeon]
MEKDIGKIKKNENTEIIVRIDDFGGKTGVTIREFVTGERYTGFTKAGTRIPADKFLEFRELVNKINLSELTSEEKTSSEKPTKKSKTVKEEPKKEIEEDY